MRAMQMGAEWRDRMSITILSSRIKSLRIVFGWTQKRLAEECGWKAPVISFYETGARTPSISNLIKLAEAFEYTTDYLLGLDYYDGYPDMGATRWERLERGVDSGLTKEDIKSGWHFCCDWDGMLIHETWTESICCRCNEQSEGR